MPEDKVISLRFREWKAMDMELYRNLEKGKQELGLSMPVYVKSILRQYLEEERKEGGGLDVRMERIREVVRGELDAQNAVLAEVFERIAERFPEDARKETQVDQPQECGLALPEYSDSFPDGLNSVLEKFL